MERRWKIKERSLVNTTEGSIRECKLLGTTEEEQACLRGLSQEFVPMKNYILRRLMEVFDLATKVLTMTEETQQRYNDEKRQFATESSQVTRSLLTNCIQNV